MSIGAYQLPFVKVSEMLLSLQLECQEYVSIAFWSLIGSCLFVIMIT